MKKKNWFLNGFLDKNPPKEGKRRRKKKNLATEEKTRLQEKREKFFAPRRQGWSVSFRSSKKKDRLAQVKGSIREHSSKKGNHRRDISGQK